MPYSIARPQTEVSIGELCLQMQIERELKNVRLTGYG